MASDREQRPQQRAPETTAQDAAARQEALAPPGPSRGADAPLTAPSPERQPDAVGQTTAPDAARWAEKLAQQVAGDPDPALDGLEALVKAEPVRTFGGEDDEPEDEPSPLRPTPPAASAPKRVAPGARAAVLAWDEAVAEAPFLRGYQLLFAREQLAALPEASWQQLREAWESLDDPALRGVLAKDLGAHRLHDFDALAAALDDSAPPRLLAVDDPDLDDGPDAVVAGFDPRVALGLVELPPLPPEAPALPLWVRRLPRGPVELCLVAVAQARGGALDPTEDTTQGASSALSLALRPHARRHPSLQRWLLRLQAQATDAAGLERLAQLLWQARLQATVEPD